MRGGHHVMWDLCHVICLGLCLLSVVIALLEKQLP